MKIILSADVHEGGGKQTQHSGHLEECRTLGGRQYEAVGALQYSGTPVQLRQKMAYTDASAEPGKTYNKRVFAMNTAGLRSP